jgi:hypothetical protein
MSCVPRVSELRSVGAVSCYKSAGRYYRSRVRQPGDALRTYAILIVAPFNLAERLVTRAPAGTLEARARPEAQAPFDEGRHTAPLNPRLRKGC